MAQDHLTLVSLLSSRGASMWPTPLAPSCVHLRLDFILQESWGGGGTKMWVFTLWVFTLWVFTLGCSHWVFTLGCSHWGGHTGVFTLGCSHCCVHTVVFTLGCSHWGVHTGVFTLLCSHCFVHTGVFTLLCSHWQRSELSTAFLEQ